MTQATEIAVGAIIALSSGEYSSYQVDAFAKVLKPINREVWELMRAGCTVPPDYNPKGEPSFDQYKAVPWLVANGYIEEIEYTELLIASYCDHVAWADA